MGEPGESIYIVKSGKVELSIKDTAGQKILLSIVEESSLFGKVSMLDEKPRLATAQPWTLVRNFLNYYFNSISTFPKFACPE